MQIEAGDEPRRERTLKETIQRDARTGIPGLLVSGAFHASLLFVMAMIAVAMKLEPETQLNFGWLTPRPETQKKPTPVIPVRVQNVKVDLNPDEKKKKAAPKLDPNAQKPLQRPVRPADVSRSLASRKERVKAGILQGIGKKDEIRRAIDSGLTWLSRQQQTAGNWQLHQGYPDPGYRVLRTDTGATALALLAFLGDGNTPSDGDYQEVVTKGLRWLKGVQKPNGDFHDHVERGRQTAYYAHSQATIAICEAYALTGDEDLRESADRAVQFLLDSQNPVRGGWKYQPQDVDSEGDLSVTGWCLFALHTARMAGIEVSADALARGSVFLESVASSNGARYRYQPSDSEGKFTSAMTAEGLLCRQWLGWERDDPSMTDGVRYLLQERFQPQWSGGQRNVYEWYYVAQVLHNLGGGDWQDWYANVARQIVEARRSRGSRKKPNDVQGSWSPADPPGSRDEYGTQGGRLYFTAMCLLILETPFRHHPVYEPPRKSEPAPAPSE